MSIQVFLGRLGFRWVGEDGHSSCSYEHGEDPWWFWVAHGSFMSGVLVSRVVFFMFMKNMLNVA